MANSFKNIGIGVVALASTMNSLLLSLPAVADFTSELENEGGEKAMFQSCTSELEAGTLPVHSTVSLGVTKFAAQPRESFGQSPTTCSELSWTKIHAGKGRPITVKGIGKAHQPANYWDCNHSSLAFGLYKKYTDGSWRLEGAGRRLGLWNDTDNTCKYKGDKWLHLGGWGEMKAIADGSNAAGEYRVGFFQWTHDDPISHHYANYCDDLNCSFPAMFEILVGNSLGVPHIGIVRNGLWALDNDGGNYWNRVREDFDGTVDSTHSFGNATDKPVVLAGAVCGGRAKTANIATVRDPSTWFQTTNNLYWDNDDNDNTFTFGTNPLPASWNTAPVAFESGTFYVDWNNDQQWNSADVSLSFGLMGDIPVIGRWQEGSTAGIGVYRQGYWHVDYNHSNDWEVGGDKSWQFGNPTDIPIVADFDGDGVDNIATFRDGSWFIDMNGNHRWDGTSGGDATFIYGQAGDIPVVSPDNWRCTAF